MKKIALILMLMGMAVMPNAYAYIDSGSGTGYDSGSGSGTSYDSGSGTDYSSGSGTDTGSGSSYTPGDISMGDGSGSGTGSGCSPYCSVPEPETFYLMGVGLLGVYLARRRK